MSLEAIEQAFTLKTIGDKPIPFLPWAGNDTFSSINTCSSSISSLKLSYDHLAFISPYFLLIYVFRPS